MVSFGQQTISRSNFCAHDHGLYERVKVDPDFAREVDSIELIQNQHLTNYKNNVSRSGTIYYIPVVYHVLHQGGTENISDEQIKSDLKDLNDSFRKRNANVGNVKASFRGISADIEIEFRLAQKKDDGTCFSGITRTYSARTDYSTSINGGNAAADAVKATHGDFPGNRYMNIYIGKNIGGAAGYTYRPGAPYYASMRNGIHVLHTYVGNIGTSSQTGYNTTIAHEAGHWLNLAHTWGNSNNPAQSSNCSQDDGVSDTPLTIGWQTCNINGSTCGSFDNVENIMEYSYCSKMFTEGQKTRMRAAITSVIGGRSNLITAANHTATGIFSDIICEADFSTEQKTYCQFESVQFSDNSFHNPTSWSWTFPGGSPSTSNQENPVVTYNNPGRHGVYLTVSNANGTVSTYKDKYIRIVSDWGASLPYSEGFEYSTDSQFEDGWQTSSADPTSWRLSNASSSGSKSAMLRNFTIGSGVVSELISPSINLTGNSSVTINFKYAYVRKPGSVGESVQFLISKDCGKTWVIARGLNPTAGSTNSEYIPTSWGTQNITINNSFFTSNFRFKIRVTNGDGNNFYIDDININNVVGIDENEVISNLSVYPNPMNSDAIVSIELLKESKVSVSLLNAVGQKVSSLITNNSLAQGINKIPFSKNNLSQGIYFLEIEINGIRRLEKVVIQ